ncbi:type VII toxin-antitoxin system MntA family adenylyltransferase antitoxin [Azomonas macrocytogenes]|uniref:Putative nucleotidyltransferase n=1 Tax=Azomonas macrocytogenes TaxID=69962 RepID=A0A839T3N0_AZOMA|nr:nucleotidyltransferase domain-containing protein [Azomonas macrocytogenes]MBB3104141.1 putative nucleotidyltransferase [Azomonas macrocytogenes]
MTIREVEAALEPYPDLVLAYVFGSVARGRARPDSDVDVAVLADAPLDATYKARLIEDIASATGRPVDLIDLAGVGEPLLGQILRYGVRIRGDAARHAQWVTRHIFNNEDFVPYIERMLAERRQRWIG